MVFGDDLQRHGPAACVGHGDGHRARVEVEDARRVERVAVLADHQLVVDRAQLADVVELAEAAVFDDVAEYTSLSARTKLSGVTVMGILRL